MSPRVSGFLGIVLVTLAQGCSTPRIRIEHTAPPCIPLDPGATLGLETVIDSTFAKPEVSDVVRGELERHLLRGPYPLVAASAARVIVRATPVLWSYQWPFPPLPGQPGEGYLRVRIEVRPATPPDAPAISSATYWARVHAPGEMASMVRAADQAVDRFVADLRPIRICNVVDMDESDPRAETGIQLCKSGRFDAAYLAFSDLAARAPDSAPVLYNFAVLRESRGEYEEAEALLLRATRIDPKGIYYIALDRVRAGKRDAEALGKTP